MKVIVWIAFFSFVANAGMFSSSKKKGTDAEGNCLPELLNENAKLYGEIQNLDKIATSAEAQLKSTVKESQKKGFDGLKDLSTKSKQTRHAIKTWGETFGGTQCKAQVSKKVIIIDVNAKVAELDKLAGQYEAVADNFLKTHPVAKK